MSDKIEPVISEVVISAPQARQIAARCVEKQKSASWQALQRPRTLKTKNILVYPDVIGAELVYVVTGTSEQISTLRCAIAPECELDNLAYVPSLVQTMSDIFHAAKRTGTCIELARAIVHLDATAKFGFRLELYLWNVRVLHDADLPASATARLINSKCKYGTYFAETRQSRNTCSSSSQTWNSYCFNNKQDAALVKIFTGSPW